MNFHNNNVGIEHKIPIVGNALAKSASKSYSCANNEEVIIGGMALSITETVKICPSLPRITTYNM